MIKHLLYFALFAGLFWGCKQKDLTPSWLKINSFTLSTNEATEGSNSHGIVDAWVYMDGNPLGVFELPCKIPVIDEGQHEFIIYPGIKNNGISGTRKRYPFYNAFEITATLSLNDTLELFPSTSYKSGLTFSLLEDFEDAGIDFVKGPTSDTDIVFITADEYPEIVQYGDNCGGIFLAGNDTLFTGSTLSALNLPKAQEVYLEIDFYNNNSIATGVIATFLDGSVNEHTPLVILNPQKEGSEVWKKIYIDLKEDVSFETSAVSYEVYLLGALDPDNTLGKIYIDNIKVVHY